MFNNIRVINRLSYLILVVAVIIIFLSCMYYITQNWFPIKRVTIKGDIPHITQEQLSYIASHRLSGALFTLNIHELQHEFHKIPWVDKVSVSREFPDAITVMIVEYKAIARWGEDGLISDDGEIFNGADAKINLPVFYVPKAQVKDIPPVYNAISKILKEHNLIIQKIIYNGTDITKLELSGKLEVVLCGDAIKSMQILNQYWDFIFKVKHNLSYINMCYDNALSVK